MFIGWTMVALLFAGMGVIHWNSKSVKGITKGKVPEIPENNRKKYNHAVGILYWMFSVLLELLGIPFLYAEQNNPVFLISILGTVFLVIMLVIAYQKIEHHFR